MAPSLVTETPVPDAIPGSSRRITGGGVPIPPGGFTSVKDPAAPPVWEGLPGAGPSGQLRTELTAAG
jgi:hypothetical protein